MGLENPNNRGSPVMKWIEELEVVSWGRQQMGACLPPSLTWHATYLTPHQSSSCLLSLESKPEGVSQLLCFARIATGELEAKIAATAVPFLMAVQREPLRSRCPLRVLSPAEVTSEQAGVENNVHHLSHNSPIPSAGFEEVEGEEVRSNRSWPLQAVVELCLLYNPLRIYISSAFEI